MTARASAAFCSSPGAPIAMGTMPTIIAAAVISTGLIRVCPASIAASKADLPASCCSRAKVTSRMEFAEATPTAMIAPINEGTLSVVPVMNSIVRMPHKRRRQGQNDHERVAEILIVHDHQEVDEHGGEQETHSEIPESIVHALDLADDLDVVSRRKLFLEIGHDRTDLAGDASEIAALHACIDLVDWLDVGLIAVGRHAAPRKCRDVAEKPRYRTPPVGHPVEDTGVLRMSLSDADFVLGCLHREIIWNSRLPDRSRNSASPAPKNSGLH